ncbi:MAG TPA: hypothetical protein VF057_03915, partial [Thermoanaerobaculia bacterium]
NLQQSDVPMQLAPWAHQVREAWRSGRVPVWNELTGAGFPLISNGQGGALSPIRILALPLSFAHSLTAEAAMKLLIALTFTFLFARRLGLSTIASVVAAIAYGIGPFLVVWMHFAQSTVAAFLPAVMYVIDRLAEQRTYGRVVAAALVVPAVLFSGHPDTASQMAIFAAAYALWVGRKNSVAIVLAGVIGTLLALPFIVPFLEALPHGFRYATVENAPRTAVPYSDFPSLLLLAMPRFFGTLPGEAVWGPAHAESITGFAGILGIAGFFSLLLNKPRSRELFFVVAAIAVFLVLANIPLVVRALHLVLPLGSHARMRFLFAFTMAIAAGFFIDRPRKLPALALTLALLLAIYLAMRVPNAEWRWLALKGAVPSLIVLAGSAAFSVWRTRLAGAAVIAALAAIELTSLTYNWNPTFPEETLYPKTPLIEVVQRHHERNKDRVTAIDGPLFPNTNLPFAVEDMRVLDAMAPARYMRLLNLVSPQYDLAKYFVTWHDADTPLLDYLNVRWVMTDAKSELADRARYRKVYEGRDGRLFENTTVLPRFFAVRNLIVEAERDAFLEKLKTSDWRSTAYVQSMRGLTDQQRNDLLAPRPKSAPEASMRITKSTATRYEMTISAPRHTLVVSSVGWWHWWRVETTGGKKLEPYRVNEAFLGFVAPPGEHNVTVKLVPVSLYVATGVAAITLMTLMTFSVWRRRPRRRWREEPAPPRAAAPH